MPPRNQKYAQQEPVVPRQSPQPFREDPNVAAAQEAPAAPSSPFRYSGSTSDIFRGAISAPLTSILSDEAMESQRASIRSLTGGEGASARILDMIAEGAESPVGIATLGGLLGTGLTRAVRARPVPSAGPVARVPSTTGAGTPRVIPTPQHGPLQPSSTMGRMTATVPPLARPGVPGGRLTVGVGPRNLRQHIDDILQKAAQQVDQPMATELPSRLNPVSTASAAESRARRVVQGIDAPPVPPTPPSPVPPTGRLAGTAPKLEDALVDAIESVRRTPSPGPVSAAEHVVSGLPAPHGPAGRRPPPPTTPVSERRMVELLQKFGGRRASDPPDVPPQPATLFGTHKGATANVYSSEVDRLITAGDYDGAAATATQALNRFFKNTATDIPTTRKGLKYPKAGTTPGVHPAMKPKAGAAPKGFGKATEISVPKTGKAVSEDVTLGAGLGSLQSLPGLVKKHPMAAARLGSGAAGALAGGAQGDTPEERQKNAVIAGATSAFLVPNIARLAASAMKAKPVQSAIYTSVLSSPSSIVKAWLGGYGGAVSAALEHPNVAHKIVRELMPDRFTPAFVQGLKKANATIGAQQIGKQAPGILQRIYGAVDFAARKAMAAGGIGPDEAARFTLSGLPTTARGQRVLGHLEQDFPLKLMTSLFPRVGIQIVERGVERMGGGLLAPSLRTSGSQAIKTGLGAASVAAGYAAEDDIPGWLQPFAAAAAGPYTLPLGIGMVARKGYEKGGGGEAVEQGLRDVTGRLPLPAYGPYEAFRRIASGAIAVPNVVQDIAELRDPQDRVPEGFFGGTKAKIPGLRETLPVRGQRLNIEGKSTDQGKGKLAELSKKYVPEKVQRALTPRTREVNPLQGVDERVAKELKRLSINISSPAFDKTLQIGGKTIKVPPDLAEKRRAESRERLVPTIKRAMDSARYARLDDEKKTILLRRVIAQAQAAGAAKARGSLAKSLKQRGAL